jgi:hypothetical protein
MYHADVTVLFYVRKIGSTGIRWSPGAGPDRGFVGILYCLRNSTDPTKKKPPFHGLYTLNTRRSCFTPFCFNSSYHFPPLLNFRLLILPLTPLGWLRYTTLTPTYSITSCGNIIFDIRPRFQEHN